MATDFDNSEVFNVELGSASASGEQSWPYKLIVFTSTPAGLEYWHWASPKYSWATDIYPLEGSLIKWLQTAHFESEEELDTFLTLLLCIKICKEIRMYILHIRSAADPSENRDVLQLTHYDNTGTPQNPDWIGYWSEIQINDSAIYSILYYYWKRDASMQQVLKSIEHVNLMQMKNRVPKWSPQLYSHGTKLLRRWNQKEDSHSQYLDHKFDVIRMRHWHGDTHSSNFHLTSVPYYVSRHLRDFCAHVKDAVEGAIRIYLVCSPTRSTIHFLTKAPDCGMLLHVNFITDVSLAWDIYIANRINGVDTDPIQEWRPRRHKLYNSNYRAAIGMLALFAKSRT